jgi:PAS domain-containing protein
MQALNGTDDYYGCDYRIIRQSDGEIRWIQARADIERDAGGRAVRLVGAHLDVTEQKALQGSLEVSERHANALLAELQHRVRNTLAVVRSIARRTADNATTAEDMLAPDRGERRGQGVQARLERKRHGIRAAQAEARRVRPGLAAAILAL